MQLALLEAAGAASPVLQPRDRKRPFLVSAMHGPYTMPCSVRDLLLTRLASVRTRDTAFVLALFISRFWSAPRRITMTFPIDRRALAGHVGLKGMTEGKIRGAIATLEKIGFLVRDIAPAGRRYRHTGEGLQRRPILFRFGPDFFTAFKTANAAIAAGRSGVSRSRRLVPPPSTTRPSRTILAARMPLPLEFPISPFFRMPLLLGKSLPLISLSSPAPASAGLNPSLDAALARLHTARAGQLARRLEWGIDQ